MSSPGRSWVSLRIWKSRQKSWRAIDNKTRDDVKPQAPYTNDFIVGDEANAN